MGGWMLEVGKMVVYMSFPVALFHYFNQPEYFEKYVIEKKREMYPMEDEAQQRGMQDLARLTAEREQQKALKALEAVQQLKAERSV